MCLEDFQDKILTIDNFKINNDFILDNVNNHEYNKIILKYYKKLIDENKCYIGNGSIPQSKLYELEHCNKFWVIDKYESSAVKDFLGTYTCKDKFCSNCKKIKQAVRMLRYMPYLEQYKNNLFHIVFTIKNVRGEELRFSIKKMQKSLRKLMRIIQGNYKTFIDFSLYGYLAALRSLEITFKNDIYHPHFHCAFVFKNLELDKNIINTYSYSYNTTTLRYYAEFEIILQKLWYMIYNDISLTKSNFDNLNIGYSVMCEKFKENDYAELFKYMTKSSDEEDNILTYENFKTLYFATLGIHQIQGYGKFYHIKDTDVTDEEVNEMYDNIKLFLNSDEKPILTSQCPSELLNDNNYLIISRKKIYQYLKEQKNSLNLDNEVIMYSKGTSN